MNCKFENIGPNQHKCAYCGFVINLPLPSHLIVKSCSSGEDRPKPGLLEKAGNFVSAVVEHVSDGMVNVTDEEQSRRMDICKSCPNYTEAGTCQLCGCFCNLKSRWRSSHCPDNPARW